MYLSFYRARGATPDVVRVGMVCVIVAWQKTSAYFYRFPESEKRGVTRRTKQVPMFLTDFQKFISAAVSSVRRASSVDIII